MVDLAYGVSVVLSRPIRRWRCQARRIGKYTVNLRLTIGYAQSALSMTDPTDLTSLAQDVPDELAGLRLDQALARMFPEYSRSRLKGWIEQGLVTVDGLTLRPRDPVPAGSSVVLTPRAEPAVTSGPEPMTLDIVHEDADLLIVNKPAGLVVHPGAGNLHGTLMNGLLGHDATLAALPRAGIIHRLDKDTSGLLLVARTIAARTALVRMLADREISRQYLAICCGVLTAGGTVDAPIGRHPVDRMRMHVTDTGKPAVTHYRVIERYGAHTYVRAMLETGRTHQIRVHFAYIRHPLVGDRSYGGRLALPANASDEVVAALRGFRRQALHAESLSLAHPVTGQPVAATVEPPEDFRRLLAALRSGS